MSLAARRITRQPSVAMWAVRQLHSNPLNPRTSMDSQDMRDLVESIRAQGVLQPLLVTPDGTVVAGHRGLEACRRAGIVEVPCLVREMTEAEQLSAMVAENMAREALTPMQAAKAISSLHQQGMTVADISRDCGIAPGAVKNYLRLAEMPEVLPMFDRIDVPLGYIEEISKLPPPARTGIAREAIKTGWTVAELRSACRRVTRKPRATSGPPKEAITPVGEFVEMIRTVTAVLRRHPEYIRDTFCREEIQRFAQAVKKAR